MADTHRQWYDDHAGIFTNAEVIELGFVGLDQQQQQRLNRFKLWAFREGGLLRWVDLDVLDFGAGHGRFAFAFGGYKSYLGVDFSAELVRLGRERIRAVGLPGASLEVGDCVDFKGSPAGYDVVCSLGLLPYVDDLGAVVRRMASHLRPGGQIIGDFRHSTPLFDVIRRIKWRLSGQTGGTSRIDTEAQIREALTAAGLTGVRIVMREYPFLATWYARRGWDWPLALRNALARLPWANWLATEGCFAALKPIGQRGSATTCSEN